MNFINVYKKEFDPSQYWKPWKKNDVSHVPDYPDTTAHMPKPSELGRLTGTFKLVQPTKTMCIDPKQYALWQSGYGDWECWLFGCSDGQGIVWRPLKDKVPNWFWRKMQYLILGNKWKKVVR